MPHHSSSSSLVRQSKKPDCGGGGARRCSTLPFTPRKKKRGKQEMEREKLSFFYLPCHRLLARRPSLTNCLGRRRSPPPLQQPHPHLLSLFYPFLPLLPFQAVPLSVEQWGNPSALSPPIPPNPPRSATREAAARSAPLTSPTANDAAVRRSDGKRGKKAGEALPISGLEGSAFLPPHTHIHAPGLEYPPRGWKRERAKNNTPPFGTFYYTVGVVKSGEVVGGIRILAF